MWRCVHVEDMVGDMVGTIDPLSIDMGLIGYMAGINTMAYIHIYIYIYIYIYINLY